MLQAKDLTIASCAFFETERVKTDNTIADEVLSNFQLHQKPSYDFFDLLQYLLRHRRPRNSHLSIFYVNVSKSKELDGHTCTV